MNHHKPLNYGWFCFFLCVRIPPPRSVPKRAEDSMSSFITSPASKSQSLSFHNAWEQEEPSWTYLWTNYYWWFILDQVGFCIGDIVLIAGISIFPGHGSGVIGSKQLPRNSSVWSKPALSATLLSQCTARQVTPSVCPRLWWWLGKHISGPNRPIDRVSHVSKYDQSV